MKKKFVLTLALVLMVVVGLTAAPLEIAGEFSAGRTFSFDPNGITAANNVKLNKVSASSDFWKISIDGGAVSLDGGMKGVADIYLHKALAEQGVDLSDITLTLSVGNMGNSAILSVYGDPNDSLGKLEMNGVLAMGTTALTVGYAEMVTVKAAVNFDSANTPFVVSAKAAPVAGVEATVGFTNYAVGDTKGGIGGSVKVDVAALAGIEDFALSAGVYDKYLLDTKKNSLYATVGAGFADVAVDAEFVMAAKNDLKFNASFKGIENLGLSAGLDLMDLSDIKLVVSGAVDYTMGGVKYKVAVKHDSTVAAGVAKLTVSPSVTIKF